MKILVLVSLVLSFTYSQCDANGDGLLNIVDIIVEVNCILENCWENQPSCVDYDGNVYETVQIGDQHWMAENLKTTHYSNGDEIVFINNHDSWDNYNTGYYAIYNNDQSNVEIHGNLYNWAAVNDNRGICPEGYHIPSDEEWSELVVYLDPEANPNAENHDELHTEIAGGFLKDTGTIQGNNGFWEEPNLGATNESGFSALPSGLTNDENGNSDLMGYYLGYLAWFWTSTEIDDNLAWSRELFWMGASIHRHSLTKNYGISVRCLAD